MSDPITIWSGPGGPNVFKVAIVCEDLGVPYDFKVIGYTKLKEKPYTDINPNGRTPAIGDPNTGLTIWESGAILEYLIETYDKEKKIHYDTIKEKNLQRQYVFYQVSGQGPYFGQAAWFNHFHPEKIPSVQERYNKEINRVVGVLDGILSKSDSGWLVVDKCTYADLIFVPYNEAAAGMIFANHPGEFVIGLSTLQEMDRGSESPPGSAEGFGNDGYCSRRRSCREVLVVAVSLEYGFK